MKPAREKPKTVLGAFLEDETFNRLQVHLEQIRELADLVMPENHDADKGHTLTALNLITEKAEAIDALLSAQYDRYAAPRKVEV